MRNGNQISKKTRHKNNRQMKAICLYLIIKRRITQTYLLQDKCSDYSSVVGVKRLELPTSSLRASCGARNCLLAVRFTQFRPLRLQTLPSSSTGRGRVCSPKQAGAYSCSKYRESKSVNTKIKRAIPDGITLFMVGVKRLELPTSCSQSRRATNCATPR